MEHYKFSQNSECEYFPCHETEERETFNCLFCFCPLYALKDKCGGKFTYLKNGVKDCSECTIPHGPEGYEHIMKSMDRIIELAKRQN